jgi:hypothetical protein
LAEFREPLEQALSLFGQLPPSADYARAWLEYGEMLFHGEGHGDARQAALARALEVAEAAVPSASPPVSK